MTRLLLLLTAITFSLPTIAQPASTHNTEPLLQFEMKVETDGIENALLEINSSIKQMTTSLDEVAKNQNLTSEQSELINRAINNIDYFTVQTTELIDTLPTSLEKTQQRFSNATQLFYRDLKFNIIVILVVVLVCIALLLVVLYWFIIRPMQSAIVTATTNVANMATTIQLTAQSLEKSNQTHIKILQHLEQDQEQEKETGKL